ncbi:MAG: exopolysaccharide biosynthesis polyprenyl glycosylphosphotransferase [Akkermansiaceae bacterium]|nr:exopolysaccharide biosynthesis polyprenyl glycosylphosphotransferase [Verrucomicrobiales bacterium]
MFDVRTRGLHGLFLLGQLSLISVLFWIWLPWARLEQEVSGLLTENYVLYNVLLVLGIAIGYFTERNKDCFRNSTFQISAQNAVWQLVFSVGCLFAYLVGTQDNTISRLFLFSFIPILFAALTLTQQYLPHWLIKISFAGPYQQQIALVGSVRKSRLLHAWLAEKTDIGCQTVGFVSDEDESVSPALKRLGAIHDLERVIREWGITQVILVGFPRQDEVLHRCVEICESQGVRFLVFCDFEERLQRPATLFTEGGMRFVGLRKEPLEDPLNRMLKRIVDLAVALPIVAVLLPVATMIVWVFQQWQSPGPVFFRQIRCGMQNRPFGMLKFRTMHVVNDDESRQAQRDDPRIFAAGAWLRRLSIDELPQFYNVLCGDMSVVGPRPHLPEHDQLFAKVMKNYYVRGIVKPGITGLAQVRGYRGGMNEDVDLTNRVQSDIQYLETWTLEMDCWIILRTVTHVFMPPRSAY